MRCSSADVHQKLLKVFLCLQGVLVEEGHFSHANDLATFLEEDGNADVFGKRKQCVEVTLDFLVTALLVEFLEVLPEALEGSGLYHI